jgi:hypothetical protein
LEDFSVQGLGNLAWAFARQAQLGAEVISRFDGKTTVPVVSGRLAHYITSFIDVGEGLLQKLFRGIAETDLQVHGTSFGFFSDDWHTNSTLIVSSRSPVCFQIIFPN